MNYGSRTYVDLHVIDAIDRASLCDWGFEADALQEALADTSIHIVPHQADTITTLIEAFDEIRTFRRSYIDPRHSVPYIHISCHGQRIGGQCANIDRRRLEQWLRAGLVAAGLTEEDLAVLPGSDPRKVALARLLWRGTTVSQGWLAERLAMRSAANVSQLLRRAGIEPLQGKVPKRLTAFVGRATDESSASSRFAH